MAITPWLRVKNNSLPSYIPRREGRGGGGRGEGRGGGYLNSGDSEKTHQSLQWNWEPES